MNNSDFPLESTLSLSVLLTKGWVPIGIEWETKPYFRINTSHDHEVHDHFLFADPYQFFLPTNHDLQTGILLFSFYLILQTESESDHLGLKVEQKNRMQPVIFIDNLSVLLVTIAPPHLRSSGKIDDPFSGWCLLLGNGRAGEKRVDQPHDVRIIIFHWDGLCVWIGQPQIMVLVPFFSPFCLNHNRHRMLFSLSLINFSSSSPPPLRYNGILQNSMNETLTLIENLFRRQFYPKETQNFQVGN